MNKNGLQLSEFRFMTTIYSIDSKLTNSYKYYKS